MKEYNSETDYKIILETARKVGEVWITPIAIALTQASVRWPNMQDRSNQTAVAVDKEICRA